MLRSSSTHQKGIIELETKERSSGSCGNITGCDVTSFEHPDVILELTSRYIDCWRAQLPLRDLNIAQTNAAWQR
eukprot:6191405-Pleurochrysis_carterae.AAC.1